MSPLELIEICDVDSKKKTATKGLLVGLLNVACPFHSPTRVDGTKKSL